MRILRRRAMRRRHFDLITGRGRRLVLALAGVVLGASFGGTASSREVMFVSLSASTGEG